MLTDKENYLEAGVNIGSRQHVQDMERFVFQVKKNNLAIIDLDETDERIGNAANLLSNYDPEDILVVSRKEIGHRPVVKFAEATGAKRIFDRFMPGTLTNPNSDDFMEPEIVVVTDPAEDDTAVMETVDANIPVVAIADTANSLEYIDYAIPGNNKAKGSVALIYYLLAREYLKERGEIEDDSDFGYDMDDFEAEEVEDNE
ncbi:MAG: 30S ribosomal protein S2 [Candidatus Nanohaloarchaea archaeon]|nr:30S ribosomal protein S2 [Candidatus Nanohaloarchaea archaeon]